MEEVKLVSNVLSHVIGTVALISLFFTVGTYYSVTYLSIQNEAMSSQLEEVADYVASTLINLVSLSSLNNQNHNVSIELKLPKHIGDKIYEVVIEEFVDPNTNESLFRVRAYLALQPSIYGVSALPWPAEGRIRLHNQTEIISSSSEHNIAFSCRVGSEIYFGLERGRVD